MRTKYYAPTEKFCELIGQRDALREEVERRWPFLVNAKEAAPEDVDTFFGSLPDYARRELETLVELGGLYKKIAFLEFAREKGIDSKLTMEWDADKNRIKVSAEFGDTLREAAEKIKDILKRVVQ